MRFFKALIDGLLNGLATIFSVVMFLLLLLLISFSFYFVFLTWCLRLHARVLRRPFCVDSGNSMCFSYWKNVRLKPFCLPHSLWHRRFQLLLKECTIEADGAKMAFAGCFRFSCYWKNVRLKLRNQLIENKRFLTVGFWSVFRKWSICTKSAIIFENLGWLLDCFW